MEKIIHFTVPETISAAQSEVIEYARKLHPAWEIRVWQDPIQKDGFLLEKYWSKVNSGAQLADLIRLDVLYRFGGVYIDSDVKLLRPLDDLVENFGFFIASENGLYLTNAIFGARKKSTVLRHLIDELVDVEPDWKLPPNITTGPIFFARLLKWRGEITVLPREIFYTYGWNFKNKKTNHRHAYGEHFWSHSWKSVDVSPAAKIGDSPYRLARSWLLRPIKIYLKKLAISGFHYWHRLRFLDPKRPQPGSLQRAYPCSDELVIQTIHGFRIIADGQDISLTPELVFNGSYELSEESFLKNTVKGGDWVVDVGSNVGSFSLLAAQRVGAFGRVFSFEPNPRPAGLMSKSLVMNWMHERVVQRPVAVGANRGTVDLTFVRDCLGGAQVDQSDVMGSTASKNLRTLQSAHSTVLQVPCVRLDDEFPVDLPIKILKIDVEGYEGQVLAGAERLLRRRCIDFVVMELVEEVAGSRWREVVNQVQHVLGYGYAVCTLTPDGRLVEQIDLTNAIRTGERNIVLAAQEQYVPA